VKEFNEQADANAWKKTRLLVITVQIWGVRVIKMLIAVSRHNLIIFGPYYVF
jgi:hypothetical protein